MILHSNDMSVNCSDHKVNVPLTHYACIHAVHCNDYIPRLTNILGLRACNL